MSRLNTELRESSYKHLSQSRFHAPPRLLPQMNKFKWRSIPEFILITVCAQSYGVEWCIGYITRTFEELMATKTFDWNFVEIKLDKEKKSDLQDFIDEYDGKAHEAVMDVLELGYKVSISAVTSHNAYCCTVSGNENTPDNNKKSITSWSADYTEAHAMMAYKVLKVCGGGSWEEHSTESETWG